MSDKLARGTLPALCTPFSDDGGRVACERVEPLVGALLAGGANGFFACGGTGEGQYMSVAERKQMAEAAIAAVAGQVPVIVQVGATSTENAIELARHARAAGADGVASVAPLDRPNDLQAAAAHYAAIGAATELPFYVYWLAHTADQKATAPRFLEAMEAVPHFAGVKFTDTNFFLFQQLLDLSGGRLNMISGPDEMCLAGMVMGSDAAIGTTYNIMVRLFAGMRADFEAGQIASAMQAQQRANRVIALLLEVGALAGVKAMLAWRDLPVGPPRAQPPLGQEAGTRLRQSLEELEFEIA